ncbi:MAG TPA: hypothetical protein VGR01_01660 [Burkholderiales bacterium]|nr:hypothetical protein [Burkholderiales bacterium]
MPFANSQSAAIAVLAAAALLFLGGCESLPGRTSGKVVVKDKNTTVAVVFSDEDRQLIADYYVGKKKKKLPPGLAKKDRLPPGLEKQLRKNGELPPGLSGRELPPDLEFRLSKLPPGYVRVVIGTDVVLENTKTRVVVDIVKDIAFD